MVKPMGPFRDSWEFPLEALFQYIITADYPFRNETKSE
jgi:hypothetical protein